MKKDLIKEFDRISEEAMDAFAGIECSKNDYLYALMNHRASVNTAIESVEYEIIENEK